MDLFGPAIGHAVIVVGGLLLIWVVNPDFYRED